MILMCKQTSEPLDLGKARGGGIHHYLLGCKILNLSTGIFHLGNKIWGNNSQTLLHIRIPLEL